MVLGGYPICQRSLQFLTSFRELLIDFRGSLLTDLELPGEMLFKEDLLFGPLPLVKSTQSMLFKESF